MARLRHAFGYDICHREERSEPAPSAAEGKRSPPMSLAVQQPVLSLLKERIPTCAQISFTSGQTVRAQFDRVAVARARLTVEKERSWVI